MNPALIAPGKTTIAFAFLSRSRGIDLSATLMISLKAADDLSTRSTADLSCFPGFFWEYAVEPKTKQTKSVKHAATKIRLISPSVNISISGTITDAFFLEYIFVQSCLEQCRLRYAQGLFGFFRNDVLLETESPCVEIEELSGYFPLFGFTYASLRIRSMPKRTTAFTAHCVDDLFDACCRKAFVHFLDKVFLDRVRIKMQHRHESTLRAAFFGTFEQTGDIRFVVARNNGRDPYTS